MFIQETATVLLGKDASKAPWLILKGLDIHNLNEQEISRRSSLDFEWSTQVMDSSQVDIKDVVGRIIVSDLATRPMNGKACAAMIYPLDGAREVRILTSRDTQSLQSLHP